MKTTARALLVATALSFGAAASAGPAIADGIRNGAVRPTAPEYDWAFGWGSYGNGPVYDGEHAPRAYDSYGFAYEYPVYTGSDVTAISVDLINSRFRHRRVTGPGVVYYRGEYPRPYHVNPYW